MTRKMVIWCPDWPVIAAGYSNDDSVAVMSANRVSACSEKARCYGVKEGLRQRDAQARCPRIILVMRDVEQEAQTFEPVVEAIEQLVIDVEIIEPGLCVLPTKGPSRYFGGDVNLVSRVKETVNAAGYNCHVGIADGLFAATWAARSNLIIEDGQTKDFLFALPITAIRQPQLSDLLIRLGIKTLGDFVRLPSKDVLSRFGNEGMSAHRLACGYDDHILVGREVPEEFSLSIEVDPPAQQVDRASFAAKRMADQFVAHLDQKALSCRLVSVEVETEHGESYQRQWRHDIGFTAPDIADRVRWQLSGWLSSVGVSRRPSAGVSLLRLVPLEVVPANGRQNEFWGGESDADSRAGRAIDRIRGLLGADGVLQAALTGGRNAHEQFQLSAWGQDSESHFDALQPWPGRMEKLRPTVLCRPPQPMQITTEDGTTVMVNKRGLLKGIPAFIHTGDWMPVTNWAGPWLYDERWWDESMHRRRACFQFVTKTGAILGVFEQGRWFAEALYR